MYIYILREREREWVANQRYSPLLQVSLTCWDGDGKRERERERARARVCTKPDLPAGGYCQWYLTSCQEALAIRSFVGAGGWNCDSATGCRQPAPVWTWCHCCMTVIWFPIRGLNSIKTMTFGYQKPHMAHEYAWCQQALGSWLSFDFFSDRPTGKPCLIASGEGRI